MNANTTLKLAASSAVLCAGTIPSSALVVMISDLTPPGSPIENFFNDNFTNVTEIRHGDYSNAASAASQDALNGTGAFAGSGPADIFVVGRSLSSGGYDAGDADAYNQITIPFINFTAFTTRTNDNRLGWHDGGASFGATRNGDESQITVAGAGVFGVTAGAHDFFTDAASFSGLALGSVGGGDILATLGGDILAAHWDAGDAPGNTAIAGVAAFPGTRLLLNLDNEPSSGNDGANDFTNLTPKGLDAYVSAVDFATPLTAIPEPSVSLFGFITLGTLLGLRRR